MANSIEITQQDVVNRLASLDIAIATLQLIIKTNGDFAVAQAQAALTNIERAWLTTTEDNYGKAMKLLVRARREADAEMETSNQTDAFQKRMAELEKALVELYGILIPEAQAFPGSDFDLAMYAAKTLPSHVRGRLNLLQEENKRRRELLDSANLIIRQTCEARDAAMRPADQLRYLGRGSDWILTDLFRRVHEAEDRIEGAFKNPASAAPALLLAAKLACLNFERKNNSSASGDFLGDDDHEAWSALEEAIAKAEGRQAKTMPEEKKETDGPHTQ